MSLESQISALASSDPAVRTQARHALTAAGAQAVAPLMEHLRDPASPIDWATTAWTLREIGDPAVPPLLDMIASQSSVEMRRRARWTLSGTKTSGPAALAAAFAHPHPDVRASAASRVQYLEANGLPYADQLLGLLGDEDEDVRQRAIWAIEAVGRQLTGPLQRIRRAPSTGPRRRAAALTALSALGGLSALDTRDRATLERLIAIKRRDEVPSPMHLCGTWYAVPTVDEREVFAAFGLSDPVPVTMQLGASAWNHDHHASARDAPHAKHSRVYVSPAFDGWRLVFGEHSDDLHVGRGSGDIDHVLVKARCAALSARFGAARWYGMSCGDGWTAWCIAEQGEVLRYYDAFAAEADDNDDAGASGAGGDEPAEPPELFGPRHPAEQEFVLPHEDPFPPGTFDDPVYNNQELFHQKWLQVKEELGIPDACDGALIAGRTSVDPEQLGPDTRMEGSAWLALTVCGRTYGDPPGAVQV